MGQHIDTSTPPCTSQRARQNKKMLKITFWTMESTFQVILSISKFSIHTRPRARCARRKGKNSTFLHDLDSWYYNWQFLLIFSHCWPFMRPCACVKLQNPCVLNVNLLKYMPFLYPLQLLRMRGYPKILFNILKAIEWEIWMHAWFWPIGCCDIIILASELKKCIFHWWHNFFFVSLRLSRLPVINFLPNFYICCSWDNSL